MCTAYYQVVFMALCVACNASHTSALTPAPNPSNDVPCAAVEAKLQYSPHIMYQLELEGLPAETSPTYKMLEDNPFLFRGKAQ
jgi:hypothetical protein